MLHDFKYLQMTSYRARHWWHSYITAP